MKLTYRLYQFKVQNCEQLVTNVTDNLELATRISRLLVSAFSMFLNGACFKWKNFMFEFQEKLNNPCLVDVF